MAVNQYDRDKEFYLGLLPFCRDDKETSIIELLATGVSQRKAAAVLGMNASTIGRAVSRAKGRFDNQGMTKREMAGHLDEPVKAPFVTKGHSTFYDCESGEALRTWIKTDIDKTAQLQQILESVQNAIEGYKPLKRVKSPQKARKDVLTIYPMGDPHIGMYAWSAESGSGS